MAARKCVGKRKTFFSLATKRETKRVGFLEDFVCLCRDRIGNHKAKEVRFQVQQG